MSSPLRVVLLSSLSLLSAACATEDDPPAVLSTVEDLAPGPACPAGGVAILTGHDRDADGTLDADEIETRTPRCNRVTPRALTRQDELAAGEPCPAGGTAFHTGHDDDGDTVLDDVEIESTAVACTPDAIWDGDLAITADDLQAETYAAVRIVTGDLRVSGAGSLDALEAVGGNLVLVDRSEVGLPGLISVAGGLDAGYAPTLVAPRLERVGGRLSGAMVDLALPALESVDALYLSDEILRIDLPALAEVRGSIETDSRAALTRASLPALTSAGSLDLQVGADVSIDLGSLSSVDALALRGTAPTRTELDLGQLRGVNGELLLHGLAIPDLASLASLRTVGTFRIASNAALTGVAGLPAELEIGELDIVSNAGLTSLAGLPALGTLAGLAVNNNDALADLRGLDGATHVTGNVFIGNNAMLTSLSGLAVRRIGGELRMLRNLALTDIAALDSLTSLGGELQVGFNPIRAEDLAALRTRLGR